MEGEDYAKVFLRQNITMLWLLIMLICFIVGQLVALIVGPIVASFLTVVMFLGYVRQKMTALEEVSGQTVLYHIVEDYGASEQMVVNREFVDRAIQIELPDSKTEIEVDVISPDEDEEYGALKSILNDLSVKKDDLTHEKDRKLRRMIEQPDEYEADEKKEIADGTDAEYDDKIWAVRKKVERRKGDAEKKIAERSENDFADRDKLKLVEETYASRLREHEARILKSASGRVDDPSYEEERDGDLERLRDESEEKSKLFVDRAEVLQAEIQKLEGKRGDVEKKVEDPNDKRKDKRMHLANTVSQIESRQDEMDNIREEIRAEEKRVARERDAIERGYRDNLAGIEQLVSEEKTAISKDERSATAEKEAILSDARKEYDDFAAGIRNELKGEEDGLENVITELQEECEAEKQKRLDKYDERVKKDLDRTEREKEKLLKKYEKNVGEINRKIEETKAEAEERYGEIIDRMKIARSRGKKKISLPTDMNVYYVSLNTTRGGPDLRGKELSGYFYILKDGKTYSELDMPFDDYTHYNDILVRLTGAIRVSRLRGYVRVSEILITNREDFDIHNVKDTDYLPIMEPIWCHAFETEHGLRQYEATMKDLEKVREMVEASQLIVAIEALKDAEATIKAMQLAEVNQNIQLLHALNVFLGKDSKELEKAYRNLEKESRKSQGRQLLPEFSKKNAGILSFVLLAVAGFVVVYFIFLA